MTFEKFVNATYPNNAWVKAPGALSIYVRRTPEPMRDRMGDFQIANINARAPGNGAYRRFLDMYEPRYSLYMENVHNQRLIPFYLSRGYVMVDTVNACFLRTKGPIHDTQSS